MADASGTCTAGAKARTPRPASDSAHTMSLTPDSVGQPPYSSLSSMQLSFDLHAALGSISSSATSSSEVSSELSVSAAAV